MEKLYKYAKNISILTKKLVIYRSILKDEIAVKFTNLINVICEKKDKEIIIENYYGIYADLVSLYPYNELSENLWQHHLRNLILENENIYSLACENNNTKNLNSFVIDNTKIDLSYLNEIYNFDFDLLNSYLDINLLKSSKLDLKEKDINKLTYYHKINGCGILSKYIAFRWTKSIFPVEYPDTITFNELIGYEDQKKQLKENTERLIKGLPTNNILLYGDRGTGKSSSVKALLNEYHHQGLRLIEVSKYNLNSLPNIIDFTYKRGMKFIIFVDDLSFNSDETSYKELKSVLEGGIESKPDNAVIYATSNRKHLIKEYFSERNDEVNRNDTIQEKLSLADRFGITITYLLPKQEEYLNIVYKLADKYNIQYEKNVLRKKALLWEKWHNGLSPRTAKQFVLSLK